MLAAKQAVRIVTVFVAISFFASASPLESYKRSFADHVLHESRSALPSAWSKRSTLDSTTVIPLRIGLAQQNLHRAEDFINQVAHPSSPDYGRHWTAKQVAETFAPSHESVRETLAWLGAEGIESSRIRKSHSLNWLTVNATVLEVERLLKTKYYVYDHDAGFVHVACEEYHLPRHMSRHIDIITPTVHFDRRIGEGRKVVRNIDESLQTRDTPFRTVGLGSPNDGSNPKFGHVIEQAMSTLADCNAMIIPACLQALYNMPRQRSLASTVENNTLGVVEYTPQAFLQSDLDLFFQHFQSGLVGQGPNVDLIDGAIVQTTEQGFSFNGESALDLEYAMSLIFPQQVTVYQVGDTVEGASFNNFLDAIDVDYCTFEGGDSSAFDGVYPDTRSGGFQGAENCGNFARTNVISTSYGTDEASLTAAYEQRQCAEYMKLGLQGVSVVYSSGDFGVAGNGGQCIDVAALQFNNGSSGLFNPSFPSTCPYVTSVGATQMTNGSSVKDPETAAETVIFSGGGFSNVFTIPDYQSQAVGQFFEKHAPPYGADRFNNSRIARGFPDVSANGVNYLTTVDGNYSLTFGTSASAPTFASMLTMINDERLAANKQPVGFVNPVLYQNPQVLKDIVGGGNRGCGSSGFEAVEGWDPVTGLGTPNYRAMRDLFMSLP